MNLAHCKHGFKLLMVDRDGMTEVKSQTRFLSEIANNEHDLAEKDCS